MKLERGLSENTLEAYTEDLRKYLDFLSADGKDFRAVGERLFPMRMDVRVLKESASVGGLALSYSRVRLNEPTRMDFSIPSKYERITFAQIVRTITHLNP